MTLRELTEEMHAVRYELLDEQTVGSDRVVELIHGLDEFVEWLREQNRVNRCVEHTPAATKPDRRDDVPIAFADPEVVEQWHRNGWIIP